MEEEAFDEEDKPDVDEDGDGIPDPPPPDPRRHMWEVGCAGSEREVGRRRGKSEREIL